MKQDTWFIKETADKGYDYDKTKKVLDAFVLYIGKALGRARAVEFDDFGLFYLKAGRLHVVEDSENRTKSVREPVPTFKPSGPFLCDVNVKYPDYQAVSYMDDNLMNKIRSIERHGIISTYVDEDVLYKDLTSDLGFDCKPYLGALRETLVTHLSKLENVNILGFGTFLTRVAPPRKGETSDRIVVSFRAGTVLRDLAVIKA